MSQSPPVLLSTGTVHVVDVSVIFELAAESGYDGMEVLCDQRWSTRDPAYLATLTQRTGMPVLAVHAPFTPWGISCAAGPGASPCPNGPSAACG